MGRKLLKKGETPDKFQTELYDKITKIEAQVLERIQKLKTNSKSYVCEHFNIPVPECEPFDESVNYYDKFWRRFLLNEIGKQNMVQFKEQLQNFGKKLNKIENLFQEWEKQFEPIIRSKRKGVKFEENQRFICETCTRGYRDQQTLMLHIKIKHRKHEEAPSSRNQKQEQQIYEQENEEE